MRVFLIDSDSQSREVLSARISEALRRAGLKHVDLVVGGFSVLSENVGREDPRAAFLGPGCYEDLEESIERFRSLHPTVPLAVILANEIYTTEAVSLRRIVSARIMPIADIDQMALFIIDNDQGLGGASGTRNRGLVTVAQFKGGVGATSVSLSLAACWAKHDLHVAVVDLDDVNPHVTEWAKVGLSERKVVADMLREGAVSASRLNEILHPVEGFDGHLCVIGQPEYYGEGFHMKADIYDDSPSSSEFVKSLVTALKEEFDVIVVDAGRSWGVSTFAMLPLSQRVLMVLDGNWMSLERTLDNFSRFCKESDDPDEFDLSKWVVVLNACRDETISPREVSDEIEKLELFPSTVDLFTIPHSHSGRNWGGSGSTFYDAADLETRSVIEQLAFYCIPFRRVDAVKKHGMFDQLKSLFS